jgi:hypothetical protein
VSVGHASTPLPVTISLLSLGTPSWTLAPV